MVRKYVHRLRRAVRQRLPLRQAPTVVDAPVAAAPAPAAATVYQDVLDERRLAGLHPYRVKASDLSLETVETNVNLNFFGAYGPDFFGKTSSHMSVDTPWQYRNLLLRLKTVPNLRFAAVRDALANPPKGAEIVCTIRHDIDGDLVAAAQQARIEQSLGVQTSYYVLHTAPYYGALSGKVLLRNDVSAQRYRDIQAAGHEIALHTDGMTLYQSHDLDGAAAIVEELRWLRSEGLNVSGSTAHNSFGVYGCNNYSIFKERPLAATRPGGPMGVVHNGKWAPLQLLDENELGLEYEANELFWQEHTPLFYGCLMAQNDWHMEHNKYALLSVTGAPAPWKFQSGTHDDLVDAVSALDGPAYVKLVVHPMHYGFRSSSDSGPWLPERAVDETTSVIRRWAGGGAHDEIAGTAITRLNEFATADRGLDCYKTADFRLAFFGHDNLATHRVSADSKVPAITARLLREPLRKPWAGAICVADPELTAGRAENTLTRIEQTAAADVVVLGLSTANPALDELGALARGWAAAGRHVLCFLEYGGDATTAADDDSIRRIETMLGQDVVDPYKAFKSYGGTGRLFWSDRGGWAPQAHYLAARALAQRLCEQLSNVGSSAGAA